MKKESEKRFLTSREITEFNRWFRGYYEHVSGASFGAFNGQKSEKARISRMIKEAHIKDMSALKRYTMEKMQQWIRWDCASRTNVIGFVFKPEEYKLWLAKSRGARVGQNNEWDF